jgi:hypothetical protein
MDVVITAEICVNRTPTGIQEHQTCFGYNLGAAYRLLKGVDCNERCTYAALIIHSVDCGIADSFPDIS